jgi:hypothetical protein
MPAAQASQSPAEACCQATATLMWMPGRRARTAAGRSVASWNSETACQLFFPATAALRTVANAVHAISGTASAAAVRSTRRPRDAYRAMTTHSSAESAVAAQRRRLPNASGT